MNLDLMLLIDKQFLETPFYGVRQMTWHLQNEGNAVNQKRIRRLMRLMRLMPIYQKPDTSKPAKGHRTYPICSAGCGWSGPTRSGAPTSHTSRCAAASSSWWLLWTGRSHPESAGLAHLQHAGSRLLRRSAERGDPPLRRARDHEHRSRVAVHVLRLDRPAETGRHPVLDGRQGGAASTTSS